MITEHLFLTGGFNNSNTLLTVDSRDDHKTTKTALTRNYSSLTIPQPTQSGRENKVRTFDLYDCEDE
jgi:hypothetical protein